MTNLLRNLTVLISLGIFVFYGCNERAEGEKVKKIVYDVVFRGKLSGSYEKCYTDDQRLKFTYNFSDRGRGPDLKEEITLNDLGMITSQLIEGVNYRKTPLEEYFRQKGNAAQWKNAKGDGEGAFDGTKLYFRYDGSPAIYEILAQRLLESENGKVYLFPSGVAELSDRRALQLSNGESVELLMISGLDLNPTYLWMKGGRMLGKISGNLHVVEKDRSDLRQEMKALQDQAEDDYLADLAQKLTTAIDKVVVKNVNVFTAEGALRKQQDVHIEGGKIKAVYPTNGEKETLAAIKTLDGTGKTLLPGMFDMHTHNTKFRGILHLAGGVTSVRDLANDKQLKDLSAQFDRNEILGPRIVTFCGIIDGSGPYANQRNVVDNLEEGLAEIDVYKALGYHQIKLYSSIRPEWVRPLVDKAHRLGMRVSGHIPAYMTASQAIEQGYNEIQHINMLFLNFLSDTIDTRTPLRHTMPAKYGKDLDLDSKAYKDFVQLLKDKDILVDLTLGIFENMYRSKIGEVSPTYAAISERMPLMNQRSFYSGGLPMSGDDFVTYEKSFEKMLEVIKNLYENGIAVVPGTDGLPGFLYHRELELYVKAGIPAAEVLKLATVKSAEITGMSEVLGSVEAGKLADLILVDGNPVEDISDIRRVEWIMKGGKLFYAKDLYQTQGIKHFK